MIIKYKFLLCMQHLVYKCYESDKTLHFFLSFYFLDEARENKCGVLVHCLAGISRSVTVTCAYLMQKLHISLNQAYDHVKQCKPNVSPNFNFLGQLLEFEKSILCQNSTQSVNEFHFHCNDNVTVSTTQNIETATWTCQPY
jgi:hypothetical protein